MPGSVGAESTDINQCMVIYEDEICSDMVAEKLVLRLRVDRSGGVLYLGHCFVLLYRRFTQGFSPLRNTDGYC